MQYCKKSCGLCGTPPTVTSTAAPTPPIDCIDSSSSCTSWVASGFCSSSFYTATQKMQFCKLSCNLCDISSTTASTTVATTASTAPSVNNCADSSSSCKSWVATGFCSSSFYTLEQKMQFCKSSCNLCEI